jgi:hypothetical protein
MTNSKPNLPILFVNGQYDVIREYCRRDPTILYKGRYFFSTLVLPIAMGIAHFVETVCKTDTKQVRNFFKYDVLLRDICRITKLHEAFKQNKYVRGYLKYANSIAETNEHMKMITLLWKYFDFSWHDYLGEIEKHPIYDKPRVPEKHPNFDSLMVDGSDKEVYEICAQYPTVMIEGRFFFSEYIVPAAMGIFKIFCTENWCSCDFSRRKKLIKHVSDVLLLNEAFKRNEFVAANLMGALMNAMEEEDYWRVVTKRVHFLCSLFDYGWIRWTPYPGNSNVFRKIYSPEAWTRTKNSIEKMKKRWKTDRDERFFFNEKGRRYCTRRLMMLKYGVLKNRDFGGRYHNIICSLNK